MSEAKQYHEEECLDAGIEQLLKHYKFDISTEEGRLMLLELLVKAMAGCYNSHTEELFLNGMKVMNKDRRPNACGRYFIMNMTYKHSNKKAPIYDLISQYRVD